MPGHSSSLALVYFVALAEPSMEFTVLMSEATPTLGEIVRKESGTEAYAQG
jgi:hypothetical protein